MIIAGCTAVAIVKCGGCETLGVVMSTLGRQVDASQVDFGWRPERLACWGVVVSSFLAAAGFAGSVAESRSAASCRRIRVRLLMEW